MSHAYGSTTSWYSSQWYFLQIIPVPHTLVLQNTIFLQSWHEITMPYSYLHSLLTIKYTFSSVQQEIKPRTCLWLIRLWDLLNPDFGDFNSNQSHEMMTTNWQKITVFNLINNVRIRFNSILMDYWKKH